MKSLGLIRIIAAAALIISMAFGAGAQSMASFTPEQPDNIRVYGSVRSIRELTDGLHVTLRNSDPYDPYSEIELIIGKDTTLLDTVTGAPADPSKIDTGNLIYAYVNAKMTMRDIPQATAQLVLCDMPMGFAAPEFFTIRSAAKSGLTFDIVTDKFYTLKLGSDCAIESSPGVSAELSRLREGARILVWNTYDPKTLIRTPRRVMLVDLKSSSETALKSDSVLVAGKVTLSSGEAKRFLIQAASGDKISAVKAALVNVTANTVIIDGLTGKVLTYEEIKDNFYVSAYVSEAMTFSEPPQVNAKLIVTRMPSGEKIPLFVRVANVSMTDSGAAKITTDDGKSFTIGVSCDLASISTGEAMAKDRIVPGMRLVIWDRYNDMPENYITPKKALALDYEYTGYITQKDGAIYANSAKLEKCYEAAGGHLMIPLSKACEAFGLKADWKSATSACEVSKKGELVFTIETGSRSATLTTGYSTAISVEPELANGVCYISARDFAALAGAYTDIK